MMAITTSSSISVKAGRRNGDFVRNFMWLRLRKMNAMLGNQKGVNVNFDCGLIAHFKGVVLSPREIASTRGAALSLPSLTFRSFALRRRTFREVEFKIVTCLVRGDRGRQLRRIFVGIHLRKRKGCFRLGRPALLSRQLRFVDFDTNPVFPFGQTAATTREVECAVALESRPACSHSICSPRIQCGNHSRAFHPQAEPFP